MSVHRLAARLIGAGILAIGLTACDSAVTPTPPPPSPPPPPPAPSPPQPGPAGVTVSGVVLEFTATGQQRPVPNVRLKVWSSGSGERPKVPRDDAITDAHGRYTITDVTSFNLYFQTAPGSDYRCLCDDYPVVVRLPITDIPVVHTSWAGNRPPPNLWFIGTSFWGTVSERVNGSLQPVEGATVDWGYPDPPATTSATGFYMICGLSGSDQYWPVTASKTGYNPAAREVLARWDREVHFELTRR